MSYADQEGLFHVEPAKMKAPSRRDTERAARPRWSKYRPLNPVKCDDCMLLLAETQGQAPASQPARWRRQMGRTDLLLCYGHAAIRRDSDGLESLVR
jgi:hypothetical protein